MVTFRCAAASARPCAAPRCAWLRDRPLTLSCGTQMVPAARFVLEAAKGNTVSVIQAPQCNEGSSGRPVGHKHPQFGNACSGVAGSADLIMESSGTTRDKFTLSTTKAGDLEFLHYKGQVRLRASARLVQLSAQPHAARLTTQSLSSARSNSRPS